MRHGWLLAVITTVGFLVDGFPVETAWADEASARQFFKAHCVECHGTDTQEGGLRLDTLAGDFANPASFAVWLKIHDRLRKGEMPPKDSPQPPASDRDAVAGWLGKELTVADLARRHSDDRAVIRRMNRTEYEYTLRDLLGLPALPVRDLLPEDGRAHGYDKSGEGLELSHVQVAKYMELADLALDAATALQPDPPEATRQRVYPMERNGGNSVLNGDIVLIKDFKFDDSLVGGSKYSKKQKQAALKIIRKDLDDYEGSIGFFRPAGGEYFPKFGGFTTPYEGLYRVRASFWSFTWDKGNILQADQKHVVSLRAGPRGRERNLGYFDLDSMEPTVIEIVVSLHPGDQIGYDGTSLKRQGGGAGSRAKWVGQGIAADWLEVDGPLYDHWPPPSHRNLYGELPLETLPADSLLRAPDHSLPLELGHLHGREITKAKKRLPWTVVSSQPNTDAARLLGEFLPRAFRRPVTGDEVADYVAIVDKMVSENLTFEDAMRWAYKTALCSPEFLFLTGPQGKGNDLALASRLSYFLWNSMPDETLTSLAVSGSLHDPAVLRSQVERMLADAKSERFVDDFVDQWLDLMDINSTMPDRKLYPEFNIYLRDSMLGETRAFFRELLTRDLSVLNFVDSDFSMLNQPLAELYGVPGVEGSKFREVKLPPECHRGGVLTQASVLKVTANGTTTTPVKRGAWVMREILGLPPDPPPPNIPAVEPDVSGATTIREQLAKHRSDTVCASCHAKMDPPGFALESFDVIGGWRTQYRVITDGEPMKPTVGRPVRYVQGPAVDPTGELKDGRAFSDIDQYKKLLLAESDQVARNVTEQLLTYATGLEVGFADRQMVDDILSRTRSHKFGLRSIIHEVVQSRMFLEK